MIADEVLALLRRWYPVIEVSNGSLSETLAGFPSASSYVQMNKNTWLKTQKLFLKILKYGNVTPAMVVLCTREAAAAVADKNTKYVWTEEMATFLDLVVFSFVFFPFHLRLLTYTF